MPPVPHRPSRPRAPRRGVAALLPWIAVLAALALAVLPPRADAVEPQGDEAVIGGRVSVRASEGEPRAPDLLADARVSVTGVLPDGSGTGWYDIPVDDDGRYELAVPPGSYEVRAESRGGLDTAWPDLPGGYQSVPRAVVEPRQRRLDLDVSMRARLPYAAFDRTGRLHEGWDPADPRTTERVLASDQPPCYPAETATRSPGATGSIAEVAGGPLRTLPYGGHVYDISAGQGFYLLLRNSGDRILWLGGLHLEGPGAGAYRVSTRYRPRCLELHVPPGETQTYAIGFEPQEVPFLPSYRFDIVVPDDHGGLRIPVTAVNPAAKLLAAAASTATPPATLKPAKRPKLGKAPTLAGLELTRRKLRVHFPGAGTATVFFDQRGPGRRTRWRTVRTIRLTATRTGDRSRSLPRLPAGSYRVRLLAQIAGQPARRLTITHRVRATTKAKGKGKAKAKRQSKAKGTAQAR